MLICCDCGEAYEGDSLYLCPECQTKVDAYTEQALGLAFEWAASNGLPEVPRDWGGDCKMCGKQYPARAGDDGMCSSCRTIWNS